MSTADHQDPRPTTKLCLTYCGPGICDCGRDREDYMPGRPRVSPMLEYLEAEVRMAEWQFHQITYNRPLSEGLIKLIDAKIALAMEKAVK